jgi:hypothetical protein
MTINLRPQDREFVELTLADLRHLAKETDPTCGDDQLRRVSVQLRNLLIYDWLGRSWRLLQMEPKSPNIIAVRLRTEGLGQNDFAVAGSGDVAGMAVGNARVTLGRSLSPEEIKARYEREKDEGAHPFKLADYKRSCAVYVRGQKVSREQLVQYVANKKGGAHLDHKRQKDEQAYVALDTAIESGFWFGASQPGKNAVYLELLSIGQNLTSSPDIVRFMEAAQSQLASGGR